MKNGLKFAIGFFIVTASLALAGPASATRWQNFDTSRGGPFFMGVSGGCSGSPCRLISGTKIIVWSNPPNDGKNHQDQDWMGSPGSTTFVGNFLPSKTPQLAGLSIQNSSNSNGALVVVRDIPPGSSTPDQTWEIKKAEDVGATTFAGCYLFRNVFTGQVAGVSGGIVQNGSNVIQWPLFLGTTGSTAGWHPDQFWCPADDI